MLEITFWDRNCLGNNGDFIQRILHPELSCSGIRHEIFEEIES